MFSRIGQGLTIVGRGLLVLLRELAGIAGAASITYGAWLLHPAAGFIVGGTLVLAGVILLSIRGR